MTHPNLDKINSVQAFVDYFNDGFWGVWFYDMEHQPNILHQDVSQACEDARKLLHLHGNKVEFNFAPAVYMVNAIQSKSI